jgi:hypothetical protein
MRWHFDDGISLAEHIDPKKVGPAMAKSTTKASTRAPKIKTFNLHWGSGVVEEEAVIETPYHKPSIQLLKFTEGEAKGQYEVRFCFYDHHGRFQRSPMILDERDMTQMRDALSYTPKLQRLLAKLVGR